MRLPIITGIIRRRILVNFRVDVSVIQRQLPGRFTPKIQNGKAIAGICLIRLEHIRPKGIPQLFGTSSENAAHRIAITWQDPSGASREGVFIPRRDTSSLINSIGGGRLFPGEHHRANFTVSETEDGISLQAFSADGNMKIGVSGKVADQLPAGSLFPSLEEASIFFQGGSLGYSVTHDENRLDGLVLHTKNWKVQPLEVNSVYSSYFSNETNFPPGSVEFDCALLMRNVSHEWHGAEDLYI